MSATNPYNLAIYEMTKRVLAQETNSSTVQAWCPAHREVFCTNEIDRFLHLKKEYDDAPTRHDLKKRLDQAAVSYQSCWEFANY